MNCLIILSAEEIGIPSTKVLIKDVMNTTLDL